MGALFFDADNDGDLDLYVVSGGNEFSEGAPEYQDRLYRNNGRGGFTLDVAALPDTRGSGSCVIAADYDQDGDLDLFVGGRITPHKYPLPATSYILQNNKGRFTDVTRRVCPELKQKGLITSALWTDADQDGQIDLMIAGEWMPITLFKNIKGRFENTSSPELETAVGWWNSLAAGDFDNDGDIDYIGGNFGLNSNYKASEKEPISIVAKDFDENGSIDPVLGHYVQGKNYPVHPRDAMSDQMVSMRREFETFTKYASIGYEDLFPKEKLNGAFRAKSTHLQTSYFENMGGGKFAVRPLPIQAQFAPVFGIAVNDYDNDGNLDILLTGNNYGTEVQGGWYDAFIGLYLRGNGKGQFIPVNVTRSGFFVDNDAKGIAELAMPDGKNLVLSASNQGPVKAFTSGAVPQKNIKLNSDDAWAVIIRENGQKHRQEFYYGSTYLSQSSRTLRIPRETQSILIGNYTGKIRKIAL
jgi:hypothetical protein